MTDIPRSYFSNPRKLPLDSDGRVNLDLPSEPVEYIRPDPATAERMFGRMFEQIRTTNGDRIICLFRWDESDPVLPIELANHNVFRLDANNQVVWQVRRVELPDTTAWEVMHERAKKWHADGSPDGAYTEQGYLDPFTSLGMDERGALTPEPQGIWRPGCVVYLLTRWWSYVLDPETGIATCTGDQVK